ncbi:hypothetical protein NLJ89_g6458 [Agrocybe chaxingu]|uniref:F-box domain-containing protein n=1 Tax=Agrocybe chaxingu TaxID=84603 RepID=A0A9W8MUL6_9AGAR|nr:hypothetical protein NLJ89_g6458 [Agrocybe chaxingu]
MYQRSPFQNVLSTNYAASPTEISQIQELLLHPRQRFGELAEDIERLKVALDALEKEKGELETYITEHAALTSPIRRVTDDILREIFIQCLTHPSASKMNIRHPPLLLGRVCSRWRAVLFATPAMWSTLVLVFGDGWDYRDGPILLKRDKAAISAWLSRSAEVSLSLSIKGRAMMDKWREETLKAYMDIVLSFSPRFIQLTIQFTPTNVRDIVQERLLQLSSSDLPILRTLIVCLGHNTSQSPRWTQAGLFNAPELRSLALVGTRQPIVETQVNWGLITYLDLTLHCGSGRKGLTSIEAHKVLSQCHNLKTVFLNIVDNAEELHSLDQEVVLPFLEKLKLSEKSASGRELFRRLTVPALRNLHYIGQLSIRERSPLLIILERWGQTVEHLAIDVFTLSLADLVDCLRLAPSVTHLTLVNSSTSTWPIPFLNPLRALLDLLMSTEDEAGLCPQLQVLKFGVCANVHVRQVLRFIEHRMSTPAPTLRGVEFEQVSGIAENDRSRHQELFQPFISQGLRILINCSSRIRLSSGVYPTWTV